MMRRHAGEKAAEHRFSRNWLAALSTVLLSSCHHAPSFDLLGSYFPAWMLCVLIALVLVVILRIALWRLGIEDHFRPLGLTYPCLTASFALGAWLLFFR